MLYLKIYSTELKMKKYIFLVFLLFASMSLHAQVLPNSELYKTIMDKDSLFFNIGYNTCDLSQFENLLSDKFEFYHDKVGRNSSKPGFIAAFRNGLCKSKSYQARRELINGTNEIYPLYRNDTLYGAIQ